ncbi:MAG: alpha/beta hydrolase [Actinomycetales bacterium]
MKRAPRRLAATFLAGCVLAGCVLAGGLGITAQAAADQLATGQEAPELARYYQQQLQWGACPGQGNAADARAECARLTVPRDYANPAGGDITLHVNRYLPRSGDTGQALVINPGGPGAPGTAFTWHVARMLAPTVAAQQAIVGFDPRGTGDSEPVNCLTDRQLTRWLKADPTPDTADEQQHLMNLAGQISSGCLKFSPTMARNLGTEQTVRDMDVLRAALQQPTLHYLGFSYGTFLGIRYAQEFPNRVGRMVLDGAIDPQLDAVGWTKGQSDGFQLALTRFAQDCTRQANCPFSGDSNAVLRGIDRLLREIDSTPMATKGRERLVQAQALNAIFASLYSTSSWPDLRMALGKAVRGDGTGLQQLADQAVDRVGPNSYSSNAQEAFLAIACWDAPAAPGRATIARLAQQWSSNTASPEIARALAWGLAPCTNWYGHQPWTPAASTTSAPILILGTRYDPATPYVWAAALRQQLPGSRLITWEGDGHTAFGRGSRCVDELVRDYLLTGRQPVQDVTCRS